MSRFLIRPRVRCENLASRVRGLCAERVAEFGVITNSVGDPRLALGTAINVTRAHLGSPFRPIPSAYPRDRELQGSDPQRLPQPRHFYPTAVALLNRLPQGPPRSILPMRQHHARPRPCHRPQPAQ